MAFGNKSKRGGGNGGKKEYDNTNRGVLFANDKEGNDKRPDKRGQLLIKADDFQPDDNGMVLIYLSAWVNDNEQHGEIVQLVAQPPQQK